MWPLLVAAASGAAGLLVRGRARASLERRIGFYAEQSMRSSSPEYKRYLTVQRVRMLARIHAMDGVRGTAFGAAISMTVGSAVYLVIGLRLVVTRLPQPPEPAESVLIATGFACGLMAAYGCLATLATYRERQSIIQETLHGVIPGTDPHNPLEASRPVAAHKYLTLCLALLVASCALGAASGLGVERPLLTAALLVIGMVTYLTVMFELLRSWRRADAEVYRSVVSERALDSFKLSAPQRWYCAESPFGRSMSRSGATPQPGRSEARRAPGPAEAAATAAVAGRRGPARAGGAGS